MSRKANPTLIGMFILIGLGLAVGTVLLLASSKFFTKTKTYVLYFDSSVQGLELGTAVKFRGVTVGRVKDVLIHFNQASTDSSLPVLIELDERLLNRRSDRTFRLIDDAQFQTYIRRGLRGRLEIQSILTGLLYVDLDFLPETPAVYHQQGGTYPEIPTAPTDIQKFLHSIYRMDLVGITEKLNLILAKLDKTLDEVQMKEISRGLTNLLLSISAVVSSPDVTNTISSAHRTLDEFRNLSARLRYQTDTLATGANQTLNELRETLSEIRAGMQDARELLSPQSPLLHEIEAALQSVSEAARSIEDLADFLKRHPNAVLSGRKMSLPKP